IPAAWAACFQSAKFRSRNARNSSGEFDAGVYPPACSAVLYLESSLARLSALLRIMMAGSGVLAGASKPAQGSASLKPGATLETSGAEGNSARGVEPA